MWRTILGVSVAIIAVFSLSVAGMLAGKPLFEAWRYYAAGGLAIAGVATYLMGRFLSKGKRPGDSEAEAEEEEETQRFGVGDSRYWAGMLVLLGIITVFVWPLHKPAEKVIVVAAVPKKKPEQPVPPPKPEPAQIVVVKPPTFPALKMQGVILRDRNSFVLIDGQSYAVGDRVGDVLVKAIDRDSVIIEMEGHTKLLTMD